jgi:hypothetical protein
MQYGPQDRPPSVAVKPSYKALRRTKADQDERWKLDGGRRGLLGAWLNFAAPPPASSLASLTERERLRKAELTAYVAFGVMLIGLAIIPNGLQHQGSTLLFSILIVLAGAAAIALNRANFTVVAAAILICAFFVGVGGAMVTSSNLDLMWMPAFDFFVIPVFLAGLLISRQAPFVAAAVGMGAIVALLELKPRDPWLSQMVAQLGIYHFMVRPVMLLLIVAIASWLWARSVEQAIRRADRAEEVAVMEHQMADQKRQLDRGIQNLLETHVRAANGDFAARAATSQDNVLWQIAVSLNNLLSRLGKYAHVELRLQRTDQGIDQLATALESYRAGRQAMWPSATGTNVDKLTSLIAGNVRPAAPIPSPSARTGSEAAATAPFAPRETAAWGASGTHTITGEWREVTARNAGAPEANGAGRTFRPHAFRADLANGRGHDGAHPRPMHPGGDAVTPGSQSGSLAKTPADASGTVFPQPGPAAGQDAHGGHGEPIWPSPPSQPSQRPTSPPASHWAMDPLPPLPPTPNMPAAAPGHATPPPAAREANAWDSAQAPRNGTRDGWWHGFSESFPGQLDHSPARDALRDALGPAWNARSAEAAGAGAEQTWETVSDGMREPLAESPEDTTEQESWPDWPDFLKSLGEQPE